MNVDDQGKKQAVHSLWNYADIANHCGFKFNNVSEPYTILEALRGRHSKEWKEAAPLLIHHIPSANFKPWRFKIVGDNFVFNVTPCDKRVNKQTESWHYFHCYAFHDYHLLGHNMLIFIYLSFTYSIWWWCNHSKSQSTLWSHFMWEPHFMRSALNIWYQVTLFIEGQVKCL